MPENEVTGAPPEDEGKKSPQRIIVDTLRQQAIALLQSEDPAEWIRPLHLIVEAVQKFAQVSAATPTRWGRQGQTAYAEPMDEGEVAMGMPNVPSQWPRQNRTFGATDALQEMLLILTRQTADAARRNARASKADIYRAMLSDPRLDPCEAKRLQAELGKLLKDVDKDQESPKGISALAKSAGEVLAGSGLEEVPIREEADQNQGIQNQEVDS